MDNIEKHLSNISEVRSLMERNTRFLSLSGLSGVVAGILALVGAALAYMRIGKFNAPEYRESRPYTAEEYYQPYFTFSDSLVTDLFTIAIAVLVSALISSAFFTWRKAKRNGESLFTPTAIKMLLNLSVPLIAGGLFAIVLIMYGNYALVAPATLIFYGLGCVNAGQFTHNEIRYLGLINIILGFINAFFPFQSLLFWALGFGVMHIIYGLLMYFRHEKKTA